MITEVVDGKRHRTYEFDDFAAKHPKEKIVDILQKTWRKMSTDGQKHALALPLSESAVALVKEALG